MGTHFKIFTKLRQFWVCEYGISDKQLGTEKYSREWLENECEQSFVLETKIVILLSAFSTTPPVLTNKQRLLQYCETEPILNLRY